MKIVILCGGMGTRLREETEYRPKPMVEIGDKPILWHVMKIYAHYGLTDFVICLGYKGYMIKDYFYNYELVNNDFTIELGNHKSVEIYNVHSEQGWRVTLAKTGQEALKGARIKRVEKYTDSDTFMVAYGDCLASVNVNQLLSFHQSHGKICTLTGVSPPSRYGKLEIEADVVRKFSEKPQAVGELVNGGFFVFNRRFFSYLSIDDNCDLDRGILEKLADMGELMVYSHPGEWVSMDTYRDMVYLNRLWDENKAFWKVWED